MKIHMVDDDTSFFGTPVEIARRLRGRAHGKTRDLDAYLQKVAGEYGFALEGNTVEERCDAFLAGLIAKGPARPVFVVGVDMHAVRILRKVLGLSREKLAQMLEVTQMTVNRWETGEHAISSDRFESIKRVLFDPVSKPESRSEPLTATASSAEIPTRDGSLIQSRQRVRQQMRTGQPRPAGARSVSP